MENKKPFIIFQFPNKFLWAMIISWPAYKYSTGLISYFSRTVFIIAAIIWSYEEIVHGVNWFRRLLGIVVLTIIFLDIFRLAAHL